LTVRRLVISACAVALLAGTAVALGGPDDDRAVDPHTPAARRAVDVALEVVPGRLVDVARDRDDGNWEVIVQHDGHEFEVELHPGDLTFLGIDYD
jgi:Peptidase propeptide and YPEB domain